MKKQIFLLITSGFLSGALLAQSTARPAPVKTGNEWKMPNDVFKNSKLFADSLKLLLNLDDNSTKKVYDAFLANTKPVDEIRVQQISEDEKKEQLKANHETFNATLKVILSPAQFQKYLQLDAGKIPKRKK